MSAAADEPESENDWLFDYMLNALRSPSWDVPIMTFIDESCILFDNDDENKLIYTEKFNEFRTLIDNLLHQHLSEIGVTEEQFAKACEHGRDRRDVNKKVFDQLIAVDDFMTFKKLMIKRNVELELEVVRAMKNAGKTLEAPSTQEEEEQALEDVLKASSVGDSAQRERYEEARRKDSSREENRRQLQLQEAKDLKAAMEANLLEMQLYAKEMELEQAELEKALAVSLQLEEERLARLRESAEEAAAQEASKEAADKEEEEEAAARDAAERERMRDEAQREKERSRREAREAEEAEAAEKARRKELRRQKKERRREKERQRQRELDEGKSNGAVGASGKEAESDYSSPVRGGASLSSLADAPSPFGKKALPSIGSISTRQVDRLDDQLEERKRLAKLEYERNQRELEERRREQEEAQRKAQVSEQEMKRRAEYLQRQRDALLKKKKEERERQLADFNAKKMRSDTTAREEFLAAKEDHVKQVKQAKPKSDEPLTEAQKKRRAMAAALGRQMKKDLIKTEEERTTRRQTAAFSMLDEQLRIAEEQRKARNRKSREMAEQVRSDKLLRAMNVQSSAYDNSMRYRQGSDDFAFKE